MSKQGCFCLYCSLVRPHLHNPYVWEFTIGPVHSGPLLPLTQRGLSVRQYVLPTHDEEISLVLPKHDNVPGAHQRAGCRRAVDEGIDDHVPLEFHNQQPSS